MCIPFLLNYRGLNQMLALECVLNKLDTYRPHNMIHRVQCYPMLQNFPLIIKDNVALRLIDTVLILTGLLV